MFAFVAVDEDGMVAAVQNGCQGGGDLVRRDGYERFFVSWNAKLEQCDSVLVEEGRVGFGVFFEDEGKNGSKAQGAEEGEVLLLGEAGSVDVRVDHGKVVWWQEVFLKVDVCGGVVGIGTGQWEA